MFNKLKERFKKFRSETEEELTSIENNTTDTDDESLKISEKKLDKILWDLELVLIESDVGHASIQKIRKNVKKYLAGKKIKRKKLHTEIENYLRKAIVSSFPCGAFDSEKFFSDAKKPFVILFAGINGTGKTTTIAKFAHFLRKRGYSVVLAAADTFRAGAIDQLQMHADNTGVKIIKHQGGGDAAAVAYDAVEHARSRKKDFVLIDTAGRMQTNINLMDEVAKIKRVSSPDYTIFVGDSLAGNDMVEQASKFNQAIGIDGIILSKIDTDARGGAALSISIELGKPIIFLGTGQGYDDLKEFDPEWFVNNLFD